MREGIEKRVWGEREGGERHDEKENDYKGERWSKRYC